VMKLLTETRRSGSETANGAGRSREIRRLVNSGVRHHAKEPGRRRNGREDMRDGKKAGESVFSIRGLF
jgi:hypothetical protein